MLPCDEGQRFIFLIQDIEKFPIAVVVVVVVVVVAVEGRPHQIPIHAQVRKLRLLQPEATCVKFAKPGNIFKQPTCDESGNIKRFCGRCDVTENSQWDDVERKLASLEVGVKQKLQSKLAK